MAEFKPINTQDEFDTAIQARLERERKKFDGYETYKDKAAKYDAIAGKDYEGQIKKLTDDLGAMTTRATSAEGALLRTRIAREFHIPDDLADRLTGEDEAALRADAELLAKFTTTHRPTAPLANTDPAPKAGTDAAMKSLLNTLKGEN